MKRHGYPKADDVKGELKEPRAHELPDDDLEVSPGKKLVVVAELHPRCGIDRDDAETREEYERC